MKSYFGQETPLDAVAKISNPHQRGFKFQEILREYFRRARFDVVDNPRSARPRQSDLFISQNDTDFLIEAKWLSRKIDVREIDDLRSRLHRVQSSIVGCVFSMSGYAPTAIREVEEKRDREILLFGPEEIRELFQGREKVNELIKRKQKSLRIDGRVWFLGQKQKRRDSVLPFPENDYEIEGESSFISSIENRVSSFNEIVFTTEIPSLDWQGGYGVSLQLSLEIQTIPELKRLLEAIQIQIGLSSKGTFTISQSNCNWCGFGVKNMLAEIEGMKKRYKVAQLDYLHHSEIISYFDIGRVGMLSLSLRRRVERKVDFDQCELEILLPGIPVDTRPLRKLCEDYGCYEPFFTTFTSSQTDSVRFKKRIQVEPIARVVSVEKDRESLVCGLVVKNPFRKKKSLIPAGKIEYSPFYRLSEPEYLICSLSDWHNLDDIISRYHLTWLEGIAIGETANFHVSATWESITNREPIPEPPNLERMRIRLA